MTSFYRRWVIACTAGELIGIGVAAAVAVVLNTLIGEPRSLPARLLTLLAFAAVGAVEGAAQPGPPPLTKWLGSGSVSSGQPG